MSSVQPTVQPPVQPPTQPSAPHIAQANAPPVHPLSTSEALNLALAGDAFKVQVVEVHSPPGFPPYESKIDARIPSHFSDKVAVNVKSHYDPVSHVFSISREVEEQANIMFEAAQVNSFLRLSTARYLDPFTNQEMGSPLFFAVTMSYNEAALWSRFYPELRDMIIERYAEIDGVFDDPPIRFFRDLVVVEVGDRGHKQSVEASPSERAKATKQQCNADALARSTTKQKTAHTSISDRLRAAQKVRDDAKKLGSPESRLTADSPPVKAALMIPGELFDYVAAREKLKYSIDRSFMGVPIAVWRGRYLTRAGTIGAFFYLKREGGGYLADSHGLRIFGITCAHCVAKENEEEFVVAELDTKKRKIAHLGAGGKGKAKAKVVDMHPAVADSWTEQQLEDMESMEVPEKETVIGDVFISSGQCNEEGLVNECWTAENPDRLVRVDYAFVEMRHQYHKQCINRLDRAVHEWPMVWPEDMDQVRGHRMLLGTAVLEPEMIVGKFGRTTQGTFGKINAERQEYDHQRSGEVSEIVAEPLAMTQAFAGRGDSGAVMFDKDANYVGLVHAGRHDQRSAMGTNFPAYVTCASVIQKHCPREFGLHPVLITPGLDIPSSEWEMPDPSKAQVPASSASILKVKKGRGSGATPGARSSGTRMSSSNFGRWESVSHTEAGKAGTFRRAKRAVSRNLFELFRTTVDADEVEEEAGSIEYVPGVWQGEEILLIHTPFLDQEVVFQDGAGVRQRCDRRLLDHTWDVEIARYDGGRRL
ncbi:hypothetical protein LTR22_008918 [Elasticomyces elasticus]|nr:hypothetical protein LTR22_008918 [Elasticomyces elasticus]